MAKFDNDEIMEGLWRETTRHITAIEIDDDDVVTVKTDIPSIFRFSSATNWEIENVEWSFFTVVSICLSYDTLISVINDTVEWMLGQIIIPVIPSPNEDIKMVAFNKGQWHTAMANGQTLTFNSYQDYLNSFIDK